LVEEFGLQDHAVVLLPGLLWCGDAELLDLVELMYAEDTAHILCAAGLLAEAGGLSGVTNGKTTRERPRTTNKA
jgi:hypothetical protein